MHVGSSSNFQSQALLAKFSQQVRSARWNLDKLEEDMADASKEFEALQANMASSKRAPSAQAYLS
jgi:hypothetical protein